MQEDLTIKILFDLKYGIFIYKISIIDTKMGMQPHFDTYKNNITIANGEIYNHREIEKLLKNNSNFRTESDIEVIPHLINLYEDPIEWLRVNRRAICDCKLG